MATPSSSLSSSSVPVTVTVTGDAIVATLGQKNAARWNHSEWERQQFIDLLTHDLNAWCDQCDRIEADIAAGRITTPTPAPAPATVAVETKASISTEKKKSSSSSSSSSKAKKTV